MIDRPLCKARERADPRFSVMEDTKEGQASFRFCCQLNIGGPERGVLGESERGFLTPSCPEGGRGPCSEGAQAKAGRSGCPHTQGGPCLRQDHTSISPPPPQRWFCFLLATLLGVSGFSLVCLQYS